MLINGIEVPDDVEVIALPVLGEYEGMMTYWNFRDGSAWTGFDFYEDLAREDLISMMTWDPGEEGEGYDWDQLGWTTVAESDYDWG